MTLQQVHVRKDELTNAVLVDAPTAPLADGAVRLKVESFSVTANNITYAVVGDGFMYWDFFPPKTDIPDGLGVVPMWDTPSRSRATAMTSPSVSAFTAIFQWAHISMLCRARCMKAASPI